MRRFLYTLADTPLAIASVVAITVGAALLDPAAGWIVGGAGGLYISWRASGQRGGRA
jgi:hypothetical protein